MIDPIVSVASAYYVKRTKFTWTTTAPQLMVPPNPSRWAIRFVCGPNGPLFISPFPADLTFNGIQLLAGAEWHTYLSRDPAITGMGWYFYKSGIVTPNQTIDVWETTPVGT